MTNIVELVCGVGYVPDWDAISSIATVAAVVIALWLPARDRRERRLESLEAQARAAQIVDQSLAAIIEILPDAIGLIRRNGGAHVDSPGSNVLYGIDACRALIEREAFCHQLPTAYVDLGELVVSLAKKWCADIEVRQQTQRDVSLREQINWREHSFICRLGKLLHEEAIQVRIHCRATKEQFTYMKMPFWRRQLVRLQRVGRRVPLNGERMAQPSLAADRPAAASRRQDGG